MEIVIATNNEHKKYEFSNIIESHKILMPKSLGVNFSFEENGNSFIDIAIGKAMHLYKQINKPVMADDSGLCVEALNDEPGIYSARYGEKELNRELTNVEKYSLLLKNMESISNRKAYFVCAVALILGPHKIFVAQETVEGEITHKPKGSKGFGYDPVFFIPKLNKTFAEIEDSDKNKISHRGKAGKILNKILEAYE